MIDDPDDLRARIAGLEELARRVLPADWVRLEHTIRLVKQAHQAAAFSHEIVQRAHRQRAEEAPPHRSIMVPSTRLQIMQDCILD